MTVTSDWTAAYARMAQADFNTWKVLQNLSEVPDCQKLLFLQMACEKLTKAHLCDSGTNPESLQTSHAFTAKTLPVVIRQQLSRVRSKVKNRQWVAACSKHLAEEIALLAPAVKRDGQRPDNCEYPWQDSMGQLHVPLDWEFLPSRLLLEPAGRTFLKLIQTAIIELLPD